MFKIKGIQPWLIYALITTIFWGIWGAVMEIPAKNGFPPTLGYVVWSITMIPCSLIALYLKGWSLNRKLKDIFYGLVIGLTGAGGQLLLFHALVKGPAYVIFPIISLSPIITILFSVLILREKASRRSWIGIFLALVAIFLLSYQSGNNENMQGYLWLIMAVFIFFIWGFQAFIMKLANETMDAESIFFYMMISGLLLAPLSVSMTDFSETINWGFQGPYLSAIIQSLNAMGALFLVYAIRYGKVMIVSPLTNALAPVITTVLSLLIYLMIPGTFVIIGIVAALFAVYLLSD
jgi:uncharacterized membrane protein